MHNILLFIIDSLNYSHVKESPINLMPYLSEIKKAGLYCENMYSQAPYTEAAVMNLYCGDNVLQNGGYLFRFKNAPMTIFEAMQSYGYITYFNSFQPQCYPSSLRRGIEYLYYNVGFDQSALWSYRLAHYASLYKNNKLLNNDYRTISMLLEDNFIEWITFLDNIENNDKSIDMIKNNSSSYDAKSIKTAVEREHACFYKNSKKYIVDIFKQGQKHPFFTIPTFHQFNKIKDPNTISAIKQTFRPLLKRIRSMNIKLNYKNNNLLRGPFRKFLSMIKDPRVTTSKEFAKSVYLAINTLYDFDLYKRVDQNCDRFKNAKSGRTHIDHYINWAINQNPEQPYFACVHIDDIHNPEIFFSYDSPDIKLVQKEAHDAKKLLDEIPSDYRGSITHDLSLRYIDNVIHYLYNQLKTHNLLNTTYVLICADHGFSFSGNPLRDSFVTNLYLENYNIPFIITGPDIKHKEISKLCSSKDIPATICKLATGSIPREFSGHSVFDDFEYSNIVIEYCGGGCPDISRRELKIAAFTKDYFVGTLCKLHTPLNDGAITEIYDLRNDPKQLKNLAFKTYDKDKVMPLIHAIEQRREEILITNPIV